MVAGLHVRIGDQKKNDTDPGSVSFEFGSAYSVRQTLVMRLPRQSDRHALSNRGLRLADDYRGGSVRRHAHDLRHSRAHRWGRCVISSARRSIDEAELIAYFDTSPRVWRQHDVVTDRWKNRLVVDVENLACSSAGDRTDSGRGQNDIRERYQPLVESDLTELTEDARLGRLARGDRFDPQDSRRNEYLTDAGNLVAHLITEISVAFTRDVTARQLYIDPIVELETCFQVRRLDPESVDTGDQLAGAGGATTTLDVRRCFDLATAYAGIGGAADRRCAHLCGGAA